MLNTAPIQRRLGKRPSKSSWASRMRTSKPRFPDNAPNPPKPKGLNKAQLAATTKKSKAVAKAAKDAGDFSPQVHRAKDALAKKRAEAAKKSSKSQMVAKAISKDNPPSNVNVGRTSTDAIKRRLG